MSKRQRDNHKLLRRFVPAEIVIGRYSSEFFDSIKYSPGDLYYPNRKHKRRMRKRR